MKKTLSIFVVLFLFTFCGMAQGYKNPIIPGFHPDPSICRAGEDYYIVNSSFEYFPGVPIFHSRDLVNWEQTGHVLTRESQLKIKGGNMWGGIYAPTIRYNDGTYYMITTNTSDRGNFLVYTDNPSGEWSDPVWIKQGGIDPSLYFEDGHCYMVSNPDGAIWLCEINPKTGEMLTESKRLWAGTGGRFPEGPHIYKRDGWYYLMISEGGTEYGHKVTIARSRNIEGPYESNPANPILTHINQNAQNNPIQGVGHADMVQAHDGSWWLVCLGFRTQNGQHHVLGRETFLAPVSWDKEGWPVVNVDGTINIDMKDVKTLPQTTIKNSPDWDFNNSELGVEWNWIGIPVKENYSLKENKGFLRIKGSDKRLDDYGVSPTFVGRRQEDINFQATTRMKAKGNGNVGMTAYLCPSAHYDLYVTDGQLKLRYRLNDLCHVEDICKVTDDFIYLRIKGSDEIYSLMYSTDGTHYSEAGHMNTRYLSTETNGGFTGVYIGLFAEGDVQADYDNFKYMPIVPEVSPKLMSGDANPLLDFMFTADPTAVEYEGRLYVYATNDNQQYEAVGRDGRNTYERIKSLVMMSTDDMVNWTYHGIIDVNSIAPWIMASWAPSIVKRKESDGKTHFYLYFSNSGFGTGVLTATSPVGPWISPLNKSLIDANTPGLGDCKVPFDPGTVIDDNGTGWLAVGAGSSCIMRLGKDMISIDSEIVKMNAPHHFEANEMNYINGTYVYTYNTDWQDYSDWNYTAEKPTKCSMFYMTSKTPLDKTSWKYHNNYLKNPGDYGLGFSNNHTHLHKFRDKWYLFYHTLTLQSSFNTDGGFRNVCVDEINVDEKNVHIFMGNQTLKGVDQIQPLNPFIFQQAETTAATQNIKFSQSPEVGNMYAGLSNGEEGLICLRGVKFSKKPSSFAAKVCGKGIIEVRRGTPSGEIIATLMVNNGNMEIIKNGVLKKFKGQTDLYFVLKGQSLSFDSWKFE